MFSLTTTRSFMPADLAPYPRIRAYLRDRVCMREAYHRAMAQGALAMEPMLG